jgi:structural maintenance of chromosome 4
MCDRQGLTSGSEEDEEDGEGENPDGPVESLKAEGGEEQPAAAQKKRKNDSMELVEYSPDELQSVDKEMLNAEITQLEGESIDRQTPDPKLTNGCRGDRQGQTQSQRPG